MFWMVAVVGLRVYVPVYSAGELPALGKRLAQQGGKSGCAPTTIPLVPPPAIHLHNSN